MKTLLGILALVVGLGFALRISTDHGQARFRAAACPYVTWAPSCHVIPAAAKR
jgi:hypothetical protein